MKVGVERATSAIWPIAVVGDVGPMNGSIRGASEFIPPTQTGRKWFGFQLSGTAGQA